MTEPAQVRLKIDPELHNEFKAMCMRSGVSMADQTARMITQFLETSRTPEEQSKAVAANAEGDPIDIDRPSHWLEEYVAEMLVEHRDSLLRAMGQLATGKNVNWLLERIDEAADKRKDRVEKSVIDLGKKVSESIESSHRRWHQIIVKNRRDIYWLGGAALAGIAALCLFLALVSGTALGRKLAIELTGGDNKWQAALLLAGDGSWLHVRLMNETRALLDSPEYRARYGDCIDRATRAKRVITCKLVMPALFTDR